MTVERVQVGDVLSLQRRAVSVHLDERYEEIGIRSFGRGVFHKEPITGTQLGSKRVFQIEPGDLLLSNVFAWEGAVAIASEAERGKIGSHRFMTYTPSDGRIDTNWASWFFRSERGIELIRRASPGSAGRNRTLAVNRFEALEIPLPPIEEQRRVAQHLDRLSGSVGIVTARQDHLLTTFQAFTDSRESRLIVQLAGGAQIRRLSDVAEINPRPARLSSEEIISFVPMAAVDAASGSVASATELPVNKVGSGYKQFRRGDVIFARITPCMQNGKIAVFGDREYGMGSTEFHVVRPGDEVSADYVHRILRTRELRTNAAKHFTGTAGQQRVPADFLREVLIPVPSHDRQAEIVKTVDLLRADSRSVSGLNRTGKKLAESIIPATLNAVFGDLR